MRTALHNYSPFLINSLVSAETSSGSTRGTCINLHQERWLLLQSQKDPSLLCGEAVEPNMHLHFLLGPSSPTGCHHPPLLFTILVLSHTGLRGDKRWKDAVLNIALWFPQTVWHWSAGSMCLRSGGTVDNFGKFFGTWVVPVCQLPMEAMQTPSEVLTYPKGLLAQGHLFGFLL